MVADHGDSTEALQYSGRHHASGWEPPLEVNTAAGIALDEHLDARTFDHTGTPSDTHQGNRHDDLSGRTTRQD